jgi:endonuclease/exonuclease/phosphatase family metal-dependent hydrolase
MLVHSPQMLSRTRDGPVRGMMIATVDADEPLGGPEMGLETLNLCWWNTGLAPPCTSKKAKTAPKCRFVKAVEVIAALVRDFDVLGIGEVDEQVVEQLQGELAGKGLDDFDWVGPERFLEKDRHLSVLCRRRKLVVEHEWLRAGYEGRGWNSALSLRARLAFDDSTVRIFVIHWPSDRWPKGKAIRGAIANELRQEIERIQATRGAEPVVLMGDFNEEPFDSGVGDALCGKRARRAVVPGGGRLYNPFWRRLGEPEALDRKSNE